MKRPFDPHPSQIPPSLDELRRLDGKIVLVNSTQDRRDPPTALRGTIAVREPLSGQTRSRVELVWEFPEMFSRPAHQRIFTLDDEGIVRLLASERDGTYEFSLDAPLD